MASGNAKTANELAEERTDLAADRTMMAAGRTLMAWIRTALSMISFGFTIYKILQAAAAGVQSESGRLGLMNAGGPRRLGLFLLALGVASVVVGSVEYYHTIQGLNRMCGTRYKLVNFSLIVGLLIGLLGLFLFLTILTHTEVF